MQEINNIPKPESIFDAALHALLSGFLGGGQKISVCTYTRQGGLSRSGRWADQGGAEIRFSLFAHKWLEIQLSFKDIMFSPICQLFKS